MKKGLWLVLLSFIFSCKEENKIFKALNYVTFEIAC